MPGARYAAVAVVIALTGAATLVPQAGAAELGRSSAVTSQLVQLAPTEIAVPGASALSAISCVSPSDCFVSGTAGPPADPVGLVAEVVGGKVVKTLRMSMPMSGLDGITCLRASLCIAVGFAVVKTTPADVTDGVVSLVSHGAFQHTTAYATVNTYKAVACETAKDCLAVGYTDNFRSGVLTDVYLTPSSVVPMVATPGFAPGTSELAAASCPSTNHCYVVGGWYGRADVYQSAVITILKYAASKPAATDLPYYGADDGIACASNTSCTAVGNMETNEQTFTYEGFWQSVSPTGGGPAHPLAASEYLTGIATLDAHHQLAVGSRPGGIGMTDLFTNGAAAAQPVSEPLNLQAVACPSPVKCLAVGDAEVSGHDVGTVLLIPFKDAA
jgi:hypothetical protein